MTTNDDSSKHKYVFVCGMPRSGTSVLGRNVARLEDCSGFKNTGMPEDEGQFLQDVYPVAGECGGDGRFGFDPRMHLTEASDLLTAENLARLRNSWDPYWDKSRTIFVEKTPANLIMTRFLQAAFPNSYFVVIKRHPVAVSIAIQKWKINVTSLDNLFHHWLQCHDLFEQDKKYLKHVYEMRYEDYVENPDKYHQEIAEFIGTRVPEIPHEDKFRTVVQWGNPSAKVPEVGMEGTSSTYNKKYFEKWRGLLSHSFFKSYYRYIMRKYETQFSKHGYSLMRDCGVDGTLGQTNGKVARVIGVLCCIGADACALCRRLLVRANVQLRRMAKTILPEFVSGWVRQARQNSVSDRQRAQAPQ